MTAHDTTARAALPGDGRQVRASVASRSLCGGLGQLDVVSVRAELFARRTRHARGWTRRAAVLVVLAAAAACSNPPATGTVTGTLRAYGGPPALGGGMTLNGAPQAHSTVTATSSTGVTTRVTTTAAGVFTLTLPAGTYTLTGACGGDLTIRITANQTLHRDLPCSVP